VAKRAIEIPVLNGVCPAALFGEAVAPSKAGLILYMDAFGPRTALDEVAERMAASGYLVLVPDLFYRSGSYGPFDAKTAFKDEKTGGQIRAMIGALSQAMTQADSGSFIEALTDAGAIGPIGTVGYCMGGGRAMNAAAAYPNRIKAAASFHGGNLANGAEDKSSRQCRQTQIGEDLCRRRGRRRQFSATAISSAGASLA
jgi:carboxymethylenebutenolidase